MKTDFSKPQQVDDVSLAFGGGMELLPAYKDIPDDFKRGSNPWCRWQTKWFYKGLDKFPPAKEGIDEKGAVRHLAAIQKSFEPAHEHKMAAVAYLGSLWLTEPTEQI